MKKRDFFKRLLGITAAAVVAPKALLAEETPKEVVCSRSMKSYVNSIDLIDEREVSKYSPIAGDYVEEIISCNLDTAEIYCKANSLMVGSVVYIKRDGVQVGVMNLVTSLSRICTEEMYRVKIKSAFPNHINIKKGDFLYIDYNAIVFSQETKK